MTSTTDTDKAYKLVEVEDGWRGGNEYFRVRHNIIGIKSSDADPNIVPPEDQRRKMYDGEGNYSYYVPLAQKEHLTQLWMTKIGPYLADWVLDKRAGNDALTRSYPWRLLKFPEGYTLWEHRTGSRADPANPRTDAYLYGSQYKIFRSPMEFVEHAIWLMKGGPKATVRCQCKYCTPGQSQRAINRRLDRGEEDEDEDDSSDGGGHHRGGATTADLNDSTRHRLFRKRPGYGANAAAKRRAAKRERSPVGIMAKDYRTGNTDGGGGAGAGAGGLAV